MLLEPAIHAYIAARGQWYFDVDPRSNDDKGDSVVLTGDGLDDLNSAILFINRYPNCRITCEVGQAVNVEGGGSLYGNAFPKYLPADVGDVYAVKAAFIAYYGSVSKPSIQENSMNRIVGHAARLSDP